MPLKANERGAISREKGNLELSLLRVVVRRRIEHTVRIDQSHANAI